MSCTRFIHEFDSCGPREANLVPMDQTCHDCPYHEEEDDSSESISDCYPDGHFDGAFEHKGDNCPECGKPLTGQKIACHECGWTDF